MSKVRAMMGEPIFRQIKSRMLTGLVLTASVIEAKPHNLSLKEGWKQSDKAFGGRLPCAFRHAQGRLAEGMR